MILLQRTLKLACTMLLSYTLIACGGGGGGGSDTASSPSSNSSGSQTVVTSPPESGGGSGSTPTEPEPTEPAPPAKTSVTLSWVAPLTRQNGDPLLPSELAGYEIYYFQEDSAAEDGQLLAINNSAATEATIDDLTPGTYFFAIATIDTDGLQSDISDYVEATIE